MHHYSRNTRPRRRRGTPGPLPVRPLCGTGAGPSYGQSQDGPSTGRLPIGRGCRAARLGLLSSDGNSSDGNKRVPSLPDPSRLVCSGPTGASVPVATFAFASKNSSASTVPSGHASVLECLLRSLFSVGTSGCRARPPSPARNDFPADRCATERSFHLLISHFHHARRRRLPPVQQKPHVAPE